MIRAMLRFHRRQIAHGRGAELIAWCAPSSQRCSKGCTNALLFVMLAMTL